MRSQYLKLSSKENEGSLKGWFHYPKLLLVLRNTTNPKKCTLHTFWFLALSDEVEAKIAAPSSSVVLATVFGKCPQSILWLNTAEKGHFKTELGSNLLLKRCKSQAVNYTLLPYWSMIPFTLIRSVSKDTYKTWKWHIAVSCATRILWNWTMYLFDHSVPLMQYVEQFPFWCLF